ncbi:MAG: hypothetical protein C5S52_00275 [ANME-2 cluster archaeon]|nr:hypothetical protein [ANME-2 cluster archaeon]
MTAQRHRKLLLNHQVAPDALPVTLPEDVQHWFDPLDIDALPLILSGKVREDRIQLRPALNLQLHSFLKNTVHKTPEVHRSGWGFHSPGRHVQNVTQFIHFGAAEVCVDGCDAEGDPRRNRHPFVTPVSFDDLPDMWTRVQFRMVTAYDLEIVRLIARIATAATPERMIRQQMPQTLLKRTRIKGFCDQPFPACFLSFQLAIPHVLQGFDLLIMQVGDARNIQPGSIHCPPVVVSDLLKEHGRGPLPPVVLSCECQPEMLPCPGHSNVAEPAFFFQLDLPLPLPDRGCQFRF